MKMTKVVHAIMKAYESHTRGPRKEPRCLKRGRAASMKDFMTTGLVLEGRWEIIQQIGRGAFSEIFAARDREGQQSSGDDSNIVAIKSQSVDLDHSVLRWESQVMQQLSVSPSFPRFIAFQEASQEQLYIVMEWLSGEDMASIRNRARSKSPTGLVPLCIASYLVRQMLAVIKEMHRIGFIHRDVKPSNFVRRNNQTTSFCAIDFGLAKHYKDSNGIRAEREHAEFRGTTVYASPYVHEGFDQCPRDDLCSIVHVFFDMVCGKLPWGDAARSKEKAIAAAIKREVYDDPQKFIAFLTAEVGATEQRKKWEGPSNFPDAARAVSVEIINYLKTLRYTDDEPNYEMLDRMFQDMVPEGEKHNVSDINFEFMGFNWYDSNGRSSGVVSGAQSLRQGLITSFSALKSRHASEADVMTAGIDGEDISPPNLLPQYVHQTQDPNAVKLMAYTANIKKLAREATNINESNQERGRRLYALGMRWSNIMKMVFALPAHILSVDVLEVALAIAIDHRHFFGAHVEDQVRDRWQEFVSLQELIGKCYDQVLSLKSSAKVQRSSFGEVLTADGGSAGSDQLYIKRARDDAEGQKDDQYVEGPINKKVFV